MHSSFDLNHFWTQGDGVSHAVALILLMLSMGSWAVILGKAWQVWRLRRRGAVAVDHFWHAPDLDDGIARLAPLEPYGDLAQLGAQALRHYESHSGDRSHLDAHLSISELVTRALRQGLNQTGSRLESGQSFLASIGSTAPFIGLFGTVWGIYHALVQIGASGQASLDKVAGPVGEALIMTAAGLFVAIPAVLAYNAFNRILRVIVDDLEAFAHDLHTYLTTGHPMHQAHPQAPAQAPVHRLAEVA